ncbi:hypothetical protein Gotri_028293 [Gossypium trilobum]|uniref:Uncharacterized protein n=1 Tax=Gossypium trilobum TaxID=34281 RepID=A0A7J9FVT4_9ROSI|nr:hypothetical protein [Gossypium trilobum]
MKQSEVFQSRTVEKKTGMTWDCESRAYGIWYTPEFGFPGRLWNPYPSCQTEDHRNRKEGICCGMGGERHWRDWLHWVLADRGPSSAGRQQDEKLKIFKADLRSPESFNAAMEGCRRVLHVSAPMDFQDNEPEAVLTQREWSTLPAFPQCVSTKRMWRGWMRVIGLMWITSDRNLTRTYAISKTETEKAVSEVATEHGLDLVTIIPPIVVGPFICPKMHGNKDYYSLLINVATVHIDDLARAMIFLREKGDLIVPQTHFVAEIEGAKLPGLSSKKLLDFGFKFNYGAEGMYDGAIKCCREKGFL